MASNITWSAGETTILRDVGLHVGDGEIVGLLGPNGSGKSSLIRIIAGLVPADSGRVTIDGVAVGDHDPQARARLVALVEQAVTTELDMTVLEIARLGRLPHRRPWQWGGKADDAMAHAALERVGLGALSARKWHQLSGGERQRAQLARALVQDPRYLILDEPTNHLDIRHQLGFLTILRALGRSALVALHDLNLAMTFCDRIVLLAHGQVQATGTPAEVLHADRIAAVYGVSAQLLERTGGCAPVIAFDTPLPFSHPSSLSGRRP